LIRSQIDDKCVSFVNDRRMNVMGAQHINGMNNRLNLDVINLRQVESALLKAEKAIPETVKNKDT